MHASHATHSSDHSPLWKVFWLYGVVVSHVLFGLIMVAFNTADTALFGLMLLIDLLEFKLQQPEFFLLISKEFTEHLIPL